MTQAKCRRWLLKSLICWPNPNQLGTWKLFEQCNMVSFSESELDVSLLSGGAGKKLPFSSKKEKETSKKSAKSFSTGGKREKKSLFFFCLQSTSFHFYYNETTRKNFDFSGEKFFIRIEVYDDNWKVRRRMKSFFEKLELSGKNTQTLKLVWVVKFLTGFVACMSGFNRFFLSFVLSSFSECLH